MKWTISNGVIFPQRGTPSINHEARALRKQSVRYPCAAPYLHPPILREKGDIFTFPFLGLKAVNPLRGKSSKKGKKKYNKMGHYFV